MKYWRDIKAPDIEKSWTIKVESNLSGTEITLSWNMKKLEGFSATLTDANTGDTVDMTKTESYSYTNTGPREFAVKTTAPDKTTTPTGTTASTETTASTDGAGDPMAQVKYYTVSGKVKNQRGKAVSGVMVTISTDPPTQTRTDGSGNYSFSNLVPGSYTVKPSRDKRDRFSPAKKNINVVSSDVTGIDFTIRGRR